MRRNGTTGQAVYFGTLAILGLFAASVIAVSPSAAAPASIKAHDRDNDGTLDLDELKAPAMATFDRLEKDGDGTLDRKETGSRVGKKDFAAADPDNDGTLSRDEYGAMVEKLFKDADPDSDGTLDAKELKSKPGQALLRLMR
jgi:hypothetical protein